MALTPWTREHVVNRALSTLDWFGYYMTKDRSDGGTAMYNIRYVHWNSATNSPELGSGTLIASDCSAYASWTWNLPERETTATLYDMFKSRLVAKVANTGNAETDFPGINIGDLLIRRGSHVAVYIGAQQTAEMHTSNWPKSGNGQGGSVRRWDAYSNYTHYIPFDNEYSKDYDDEDPDYNPWDGSEQPNPPYDPSDSTPGIWIATWGLQYTKRYLNMKHWRM